MWDLNTYAQNPEKVAQVWTELGQNMKCESSRSWVGRGHYSFLLTLNNCPDGESGYQEARRQFGEKSVEMLNAVIRVLDRHGQNADVVKLIWWALHNAMGGGLFYLSSPFFLFLFVLRCLLVIFGHNDH